MDSSPFLKNRSLKALGTTGLGTTGLCTLALLLTGCGNGVNRPTILLDAGTEDITKAAPKNPGVVVTEPVEPETLEDERVLGSLPREAPNDEMSRDDFLKIIEAAKKSAPPKPEVRPSAEAEPKVDPKPEATAAAKPKPEVKIEPTPAKPLPKAEPRPKPAVKTPATPAAPAAKKEKPAPKKITPPVEKAPEVNPEPTAETADETVDPDDLGIDAEDEIASAAYTGPTAVIDRPYTTQKFQLSETAGRLGQMDPVKYRQLQKDTMGTSFRACNFFLITALVEAQITDERHLPLYQAALFDTKYFEPKGWAKITVKALKEWFREGRTFDVALQRNAPRGKRHGHVAIPVGLNEKGQILVAEGIYARISNRIQVYSDTQIATKYNLYVRY